MTHKIINAISSRKRSLLGQPEKYIAVHYLRCGWSGSRPGIGRMRGALLHLLGRDYLPEVQPGCRALGGRHGRILHPEAPEAGTATLSALKCAANCDGNAASAEDKRWYFTKETQEACAWLVAKLRHEQGIPSTNVLRHYDIVNKTCPAPYVHNNGYKTSWTWTTFKQRAEEYFNADRNWS